MRPTPIPKILVLARQDGRPDSFPIWIGAAEGHAIACARYDVDAPADEPRPDQERYGTPECPRPPRRDRRREEQHLLRDCVSPRTMAWNGLWMPGQATPFTRAAHHGRLCTSPRMCCATQHRQSRIMAGQRSRAAAISKKRVNRDSFDVKERGGRCRPTYRSQLKCKRSGISWTPKARPWAPRSQSGRHATRQASSHLHTERRHGRPCGDRQCGKDPTDRR